MRIAVDAMGGDYAPREIVKGAVQAASLPGVDTIILVGMKDAIEAELGPSRDHPRIRILHASEAVGMDEHPAQAVRRKKDASISRAIDLIKSGEADAVVSAGNTGAVVVAATLKLRTLESVERPAIAAVLPTMERPLILIDAGANTDCSARLLVQFAFMGAAYSRVIFAENNPVVGLMSIGGEDSKGNEVTKEAFALLEKTNLNFRGNVEGHDLFKGQTDVVVCDGFVGNVVLKTSESAAHVIAQWLKKEFSRNWLRKFGAGLLRGAWSSLKNKLDPEMYGGAPLLGVNGVCIITHGASSGKAIYHAVRVAVESVAMRLNETIVADITRWAQQTRAEGK